MGKEPIVIDGVEYEWKTLGGLFGLYRKDQLDWPKLDVSSYQPKAPASHDEQN